MSSVPPYGLAVPMLVGRRHAAAHADRLHTFGFDITPVSEINGVASATKMSRSIIIKGLGAMVIESYSTARKYGVEDAMIATLQETFPSIDWQKQDAYFFGRVVQHGKRRAEEMREAANTVQDAGFRPTRAAAIAKKRAGLRLERRTACSMASARMRRGRCMRIGC